LIRAPGSDPCPVSLIGPGPGFDVRCAMTTDLDDPVIIATLTTAGGKPAGPLLIYGCHRLHKAAMTGADLPSFVLTAEESLAIRHASSWAANSATCAWRGCLAWRSESRYRLRSQTRHGARSSGTNGPSWDPGVRRIFRKCQAKPGRGAGVTTRDSPA
jgi:hypothetical protein